MAETENKETGKQKKSKKKSKSSGRMLAAIVVMLILCVAALGYIVKLSGSRTGAEGTGEDAAAESAAEAAEEAAADVQDSAEEAAEESAAADQGSEHIYSWRGTSDTDEHSFAVYDKAIEAGSGYIEMGLVVSASDTPYAATDDYAKDMTGYDGYFSGMTDGQIDGITTRNGDKILKIRDIFDKYGKDVNYVIEIKYRSDRNTSAFRKLIEDSGYKDVVTLECAYYNVLQNFEEDYPDMPKMFLCGDQGSFNNALDISAIDIISVSKDLMTEANCKAAHDSGKKLNVRTLDNEEDIRAAIEMGVDSYFTTDTALAAGLEAQYRPAQ